MYLRIGYCNARKKSERLRRQLLSRMARSSSTVMSIGGTREAPKRDSREELVSFRESRLCFSTPTQSAYESHLQQSMCCSRIGPQTRQAPVEHRQGVVRARRDSATRFLQKSLAHDQMRRHCVLDATVVASTHVLRTMHALMAGDGPPKQQAPRAEEVPTAPQ